MNPMTRPRSRATQPRSASLGRCHDTVRPHQALRYLTPPQFLALRRLQPPSPTLQSTKHVMARGP